MLACIWLRPRRSLVKNENDMKMNESFVSRLIKGFSSSDTKKFGIWTILHIHRCILCVICSIGVKYEFGLVYYAITLGCNAIVGFMRMIISWHFTLSVFGKASCLHLKYCCLKLAFLKASIASKWNVLSLMLYAHVL